MTFARVESSWQLGTLLYTRVLIPILLTAFRDAFIPTGVLAPHAAYV